MSASSLVRASALGALTPTAAPRRSTRPACVEVVVRQLHRARPGPRPRRATTAAGMSDPGYWDSVFALMTPDVTVDLSPPSLAALAIGGVLVLGHSWESIESSRGWRDSRDRAARAAAAEPEPTSAPNSAPTSASTSAPVRTARARPMTPQEREAAAAEARAARVLAAASVRAAIDSPSPSPSPSPEAAILDVCTNAACAKLGAKALMANLVEVGERAGVPCEIRRSRCLDACGAGCVVRVRGARGLTTEYHVGEDEAVELLEVATGRAIEDARVA